MPAHVFKTLETESWKCLHLVKHLSEAGCGTRAWEDEAGQCCKSEASLVYTMRSKAGQGCLQTKTLSPNQKMYQEQYNQGWRPERADGTA